MRLSKIIPVIALCLPLAGCFAITGLQKPVERVYLKESSFAQMPGWSADAVSAAVVPLQRSCARIVKKDAADEFGVGGFAGTAGAWQDICRELFDAVLLTDEETRAFFEKRFTPYEVSGDKGREGLFTGYYEPVLHGSRTKHAPFLIPLYGRPDGLISVNLGDFRPALKGETIMGRVEGEKLIPYYKRAEIEKGALDQQHKEIVWVDNAVDAFFLHIQGSGQIKIDNEPPLHVGYAAANGQPYLAIGKALLDRGALAKDNVSMQAIRDWLEKNPAEAAEVMNLNTSYIFFQQLKTGGGPLDGPLGAEGVSLTPMRSLAVDRKQIPYGLPLWLDADEPDGQPRLQRLMVAQDTGGAITGAVRGDFFWGAGEEAAHKAGLMKSKGRFWVLLPKAVVVKSSAPWWGTYF